MRLPLSSDLCPSKCRGKLLSIKKLEGSNIWEFRTLYDGMCYRLFSFWDTETQTLIIATHGIVKKTGKTPPKEIAKAESLRKQYFELKKK